MGLTQAAEGEPIPGQPGPGGTGDLRWIARAGPGGPDRQPALEGGLVRQVAGASPAPIKHFAPEATNEIGRFCLICGLVLRNEGAGRYERALVTRTPKPMKTRGRTLAGALE